MLQFISKFFYVLPSNKSKLVLLVIILLFNSLLEALGIGLIGPFIKVASTPDIIHSIAPLEYVYNALNIQSSSQFIPILGMIVAIVFCFRSFSYLLARTYIYHFCYKQYELLISKLLKAYLEIPYTFHLKCNTASIVKNIVVEVSGFTQNCLLASLMAMSNAIIAIALLILLANTSPLLLILILGSLIPMLLFLKVFRGKFAEWGKEKSQSNQEMIRILNHSLGSIKETRIIGCEDYFYTQIQRQGERYSRSSTFFQSSQVVPKILIESMLVIFVIAYISLYQVITQQGIGDLTAVLGVFAVTALRLIPATSQFAQAMGSIQNSSYTLDLLYKDLKAIGQEGTVSLLPSNYDEKSLTNKYKLHTQNRSSFINEINLVNIQYSYPGTSDIAIDDISLKIEKGQSVAFIGKSGSGKTTLVDIILGLLSPTQGDIQVDGKSIYSDLRGWQNMVGYIPQSIFLIDDTIEKNIAFGVPDYLIDPERMSAAVKAAQLEELVRQLPEGIKTGVGERGVRLSGGQRQRIGIARALYHEREILILDEATSALDSETESQISESISSLAGKKTLIIIAHRLSTIQHCDHIYRLDQGMISQSGNFTEVVTHA
ncbi:MAG: ABC transporter ATP-binding protein [Thermosynechococcaceae cyanobacterium]